MIRIGEGSPASIRAASAGLAAWSNLGKAAVGIGITSVACSARADCAASGGYVDESFNFLVFVTGRHGGRAADPGEAGSRLVPGQLRSRRELPG